MFRLVFLSWLKFVQCLCIAPSVSALQILLNACEEELLAIDMYVNKKKSMCIRFGRRHTEQCVELVTADGGHMRCVDKCRYLGVYFTRGCSLKCCLKEAKSRFFKAFNDIFIKTGRCASEPVICASENSICTLFISDARQQLRGIFMQFGKNIQTACQLRNAVYRKNFDS